MRKVIEFTATHGRDKGRKFQITEMSAAATEEWAMRLIFAMMNAGVEIPANIASLGLAGLYQLGLNSLGKVPFDSAKPLLDQMMGCVKCMSDPDNSNFIRPLVESDIDEAKTIIQIRKAVFELHTSALKTDAP
ncbi:MAG: hypothetical protein ACYC4K_07315 [Thiobacillus sp.]